MVKCADKYLNQDGLNIVQIIFFHAQGIWDKASCETCFDRKEKNIPKYKDVQEFEKSREILQYCESNNNGGNKNPCEECINEYETLNQKYKMLENIRGGKICFDIQDKVYNNLFIKF